MASAVAGTYEVFFLITSLHILGSSALGLHETTSNLLSDSINSF